MLSQELAWIVLDRDCGSWTSRAYRLCKGGERISRPVTFCSPPHFVNSYTPECAHIHLDHDDFGGDMVSKEYLETARTLLRAAENMTDPRVAGQLKALAEDYERRAEKAAHADAAKALARSSARSEREQSDRLARPLSSVDDHHQAKRGRPPL